MNMSFDANVDRVPSEDLKAFCMQLLRRAQWKPTRQFKCGSRVEIPYHPVMIKVYSLNMNTLDSDKMIYDNFRFAFNRSVSAPDAYCGIILRIYPDDVHPGYVRLIREKNQTELFLSDLHKLVYSEKIHGPAVLIYNKKRLFERRYSLCNAAINKMEIDTYSVLYQDVAYAVHSPYWPDEANEWITRRRSRGFPSKSCIKRVVSYGCDFVQVSHNRLKNDNEWRFSFSRAESFIIAGWSVSQKFAYLTLWALNKRIASSNLCSYYFKTLMFWACEEKAGQFWRYDLLSQSVCEMLIEMMTWVKSKFCVNYFIPGNNMMDHLNDSDLSREIEALWTVLHSHQLITQAVNICANIEIRAPECMCKIESQAWFIRSLVIHQRINNDDDNYTDLFCTDLTTELQSALYIELSDIYRGLCYQQKSVNSGNVSSKHIYFLKSESHLLLSVNLCETDERGILDKCSGTFFDNIIGPNVMRCDPDVFIRANNDNMEVNNERRYYASDTQTSLNGQNKQKCMLYSRSLEMHVNQLINNLSNDTNAEGRKLHITVYDIKNKYFDAAVNTYKEWPGQSPTVNISWFISKAYLANLYYTTQCDVSLTIKICDEINNVFKQSRVNEWFAERTFYVAISTQWTSIYDKEIQELLGFFSLCSYVIDPSNRSANLGSCPVQFALYVKARVEISSCVCNRYIINTYIVHDFREHEKICRCDSDGDPGYLIIRTALHIIWLKNGNDLTSSELSA